MSLLLRHITLSQRAQTCCGCVDRMEEEGHQETEVWTCMFSDIHEEKHAEIYSVERFCNESEHDNDDIVMDLFTKSLGAYKNIKNSEAYTFEWAVDCMRASVGTFEADDEGHPKLMYDTEGRLVAGRGC